MHGRKGYKKSPPGGGLLIDYWPRFVPDGRAFFFGAADLAGFFVAWASER